MTTALYEAAAELSATAADLAAAIDTADPAADILTASARDLVDTITAALGAIPPEVLRDPDPYQAVSALYRYRHHLTPDLLRSLAYIWVCGSAARYGEPYETWQFEDLDLYRTHDTAQCHADDDTGPCPPPLNLAGIARRLRVTLDANRRPAISDANALDVQVLVLAEEAGELVGAYRRWAGKARRTGTRRDLEDEIADVLISTALVAERAGIDLNQAVTAKLGVIYTRGWRQDDAPERAA
jgi:NTP pyrophosphatase (non-canonical NTP hydrolase)